jgi:hypothetical protein
VVSPHVAAKSVLKHSIREHTKLGLTLQHFLLGSIS